MSKPYSEVEHCGWNCQFDKMYGYTNEVRGVISIDLFQYSFCWKDDSETCHCAKLVTNWKCQNNTRTLTLPAHLQGIRVGLRISGVT